MSERGWIILILLFVGVMVVGALLFHEQELVEFWNETAGRAINDLIAEVMGT